MASKNYVELWLLLFCDEWPKINSIEVFPIVSLPGLGEKERRETQTRMKCTFRANATNANSPLSPKKVPHLPIPSFAEPATDLL